MALTVGALRSWQTDPLGQAGTDLQATADLLDELYAGVGSAVGSMSWQSDAADAARLAADDLGAALRMLSESFTVQAETLQRARGVLDAAQELLRRAEAVAAEHGLHVLDDGAVTRPQPVLHGADDPPGVLAGIARQQEQAAEARVRAQSLAREALASAEECDRDAAHAVLAGDGIGQLLARVAPGMAQLFDFALPVAGMGAALRAQTLAAVDGREMPAAGTDPFQVAAWWASLPAGVQTAVAASSPSRLGSLDGIPAVVRDRANRAALATERAAVLAEMSRLKGRLNDNLFGGWFTDDDAALGYAKGKLEALDQIEATIALDGRRLLVLDLSDEQAKAAVAIGDVDTAPHVAVFTPGLTTTVQGSLERYDRQMDALRLQADRVALREGGGGVAVVSWLAYEAPQWGDTWRPSRSVVNDEAAQRGADRLSAFYTGLDAARENSVHLTALGHSYGSLTTGLALQQGTGVDDAVFFGSPGLGTSDVRELGLQPGRAYVVEARGDYVADLARFGIDPNQLRGITSLSAEAEQTEGRSLFESTGHSGYLADDTTSQFVIAAVVAGAPHLAPRDSGRGLGDALQTPVPGSHP